MAKVNWHPSGSLPERLTVAGVFWAVVLLVALAVGAVLGLTVRVAVAGLEVSVPSLTVYVNESSPE